MNRFKYDRYPPHFRLVCSMVSGVLAVVLAALAVRVYSVNGGSVWRAFVALAAASAVAALFRWGCLIPSLVLGITFGIFNDAAIKHGSIESQMWETVYSIAFGGFIGLAIGFAADRATFHRPRSHSEDHPAQSDAKRTHGGPA
ncbi:MAG: hypothetical protein WD851_10455 [Pirellulales bacterium]